MSAHGSSSSARSRTADVSRRPASLLTEVSALSDPAMLVEIEAVAVR